MICYFSATGNSRHVANRLAAALGEKAVSILEVQDQTMKIGAGERFGVVTPDYCGGLPSVVLDFLQKGKIRIEKTAETFLVVTYGNNSGASGAVAAKAFKKNTGRSFDAMYGVKMPDNWTPVFDLTDQAMVTEINRKADELIDGIIAQMKSGAKGDFIPDKLSKLMQFGYKPFYNKLSKTSHLHVEDTCIGCGICAEKCPIQAIAMRDGKPTWTKENCVMCLGCLHRCLQFAIQYGQATKDHGQYLHPDEK